MSSEPAHISKRAVELLAPPVAYFGPVLKAYENMWSPENAGGSVPLAVAQNIHLIQDFVDKMKLVETKTTYPEYVMIYGRGQGLESLCEAFAGLLQRTFLNGYKMDPMSICISSGLSGVLDNLFHLIADDNDGVLIPAPYYPVFDNDLEARNHVKPVPVHLDIEEKYRNVFQQLDEAATVSGKRGHPIKALLITNPNNPLGIVYSEQIVTDMITWCLQNKVHYVSDEVYALSIFKPGGPKFVSALNVAEKLVQQNHFTQDDVDKYVHFLYGISKDWGAAGLSLGFVYTKNKELNIAMGRLIYFNNVSNHTQYILGELFNDVEWTNSYIHKNARALEQSYELLSGALTKAGIPFTPATAGMFVWLDLKAWLKDQTWEAEWELFSKMAEEALVVLTPGKDCHAEEPGYFRLCFACMPREALTVAVERMERFLGGFQKY